MQVSPGHALKLSLHIITQSQAANSSWVPSQGVGPALHLQHGSARPPPPCQRRKINLQPVMRQACSEPYVEMTEWEHDAY